MSNDAFIGILAITIILAIYLVGYVLGVKIDDRFDKLEGKINELKERAKQ